MSKIRDATAATVPHQREGSDADTDITRRRVIIMGAAGRDFHNFNVIFRDDPTVEVAAFTAAQIPGISGRRYPPSLAGRHYPDGIPIFEESELERLCRDRAIDEVIFAYSDVPHATVMHAASRVLACGADFSLLGPRRTMLAAAVPVIAISATRTGCGKSQCGRWLSELLGERGLRVAVIRHPMPYGDLAEQAVQRFSTRDDLDAANCTIEEREEYEPHLALGHLVFAGVDYDKIVVAAERESDVILWEGGNNDFPFLQPDLHIVMVDALRPGQETTHHPGEAVLRMADVVVVNKVDAAAEGDIASIETTVARIRPNTPIIRARSPVRLDDPGMVRDKRVMVVEDGPTITHGGMSYGAGVVAAEAAGVIEIVDPRGFAAPALAEVYARYSHIGPVLPAVGYDDAQIDALAETIKNSDVDLVIAATPVDFSAIVPVDRPVVRARYEFADDGKPNLQGVIDAYLATLGFGGSC